MSEIMHIGTVVLKMWATERSGLT